MSKASVDAGAVFFFFLTSLSGGFFVVDGDGVVPPHFFWCRVRPDLLFISLPQVPHLSDMSDSLTRILDFGILMIWFVRVSLTRTMVVFLSCFSSIIL